MPFPVPGRIAEMLRRSTVQIRAQSKTFAGNGSGIALADGRVLTNSHVVSGTAELMIDAWDGTVAAGRVVRKDVRHDLALLEAKGLAAVPASFSSTTPRNGQPVIAVGNPLGFVGAVSTGTVHRLAPIAALGRHSWIQSDVRLAPGNSGGPLADIHGDLVGVNAMIAGPFALAIPMERVQAFLSLKSQPPALGVTVRPVPLRSRTRQLGLILLEVEKNSPAEQASLFPGDVVVGVSGEALRSPDDLHLAISRQETLVLDFVRGGSPRLRQVAVQLSPAPVVTAA